MVNLFMLVSIMIGTIAVNMSLFTGIKGYSICIMSKKAVKVLFLF